MSKVRPMGKDELRAYGERVAAEAPPLSDEQRERIARILLSAPIGFVVSKPKRIEVKR